MWRLIKGRNHGQRGDTIVEVLISVAVVSMVLAAGYAITVRNVGTNQDTQEHNQAQQIAQQQIEQLRALAVGGDLDGPFTPGSCVVPNVSTNKPGLTAGAACIFNSDGISGVGSCGGVACYEVSIKQITLPPTATYEVTVKWDNTHGAKSQLILDYGI